MYYLQIKLNLSTRKQWRHIHPKNQKHFMIPHQIESFGTYIEY
jgi:hypothetical protein